MSVLIRIYLISLMFTGINVHASCPINHQMVKEFIHSDFNGFSPDFLFQEKLNTHELLKNAYKDGHLDRKCSILFRQYFYEIRKKEDYLDEQSSRLSQEERVGDAFSGDRYLRVNPLISNGRDLKKILKSGDIILSRGKAYTSSAIAHLGEFDTQFSHMSYVYIDDSGKMWTVEAHIEIGSFVREIQDHIDDQNARTMVFRFHQSKISHLAARAVFEKVKKAFNTTGPIPYDFGFDKVDSSELFCSEIISHGFDLISNKRIEIPMFESQIMTRKPKIVKQLGIKAAKSFVPSDIEVDPRFEIVAEYRNPTVIKDVLQKDAVIQMLFDLSDKKGHSLVQASTGTSLIYRNIVWPMRRIPYLRKFFEDKLPLNMSREMVGYFGVLESIGEILQGQIQSVENKMIKNNSRMLTSEERLQILNEFTQKNTAEAKKFRRSFK